MDGFSGGDNKSGKRLSTLRKVFGVAILSSFIAELLLLSLPDLKLCILRNILSVGPNFEAVCQRFDLSVILTSTVVIATGATLGVLFIKDRPYAAAAVLYSVAIAAISILVYARYLYRPHNSRLFHQIEAETFGAYIFFGMAPVFSLGLLLVLIAGHEFWRAK